MKNIFAKFQDYVKKPNRNVFDMSFRNNFTTKFGQLTPVFCKEVIPGDSFKIDTEVGMQLMPMKFPVQTPLRAFVHFFYVRNRNTWKDWMDFIGGTKENLVLPYVQPLDKKQFFRVGGLADYLGVPNTMYGTYGRTNETSATSTPIGGNYNIDADGVSETEGNAFVSTFTMGHSVGSYEIPTAIFQDYVIDPSVVTPLALEPNATLSSHPSAESLLSILSGYSYPDIIVTPEKEYFQSLDTNSNRSLLFRNFGSFRGKNLDLLESVVLSLEKNPFKISDHALGSVSLAYYSGLINNLSFTIPVYFIGYNVAAINQWRVVRKDLVFAHRLDSETGISYFECSFKFTEEEFSNFSDIDNIQVFMFDPQYFNVGYSADGNDWTLDSIEYRYMISVFKGLSIKSVYSYTGDVVIGGDYYDNTPYDSAIHLNALPFRSYEAIYNAYYRNPQNNPFILDGVPEYNRYNTTYEGGADNTQYDLYFRNWEYDFLTSAVQSPQQGVAPLVGISVTGEASFVDDEGNNYYAQAILDDDGEITGWQSHSSNMPVGSLRLLMDMANTGISINDLRNVNAFQRFLENNIRRGLKYRDQIMSHFGVKVRYDELDMPEFIGGCSGDAQVYKVSQTSESGDTPMGSFVGQAQFKFGSKHSITHYCDEHGFIIGIMSVVPIPVYSQLLPKHFVKSNQLDYYFSEFGHIGYQPIQQLEVSPLQTFYAGDDLHAVFGYNRAWYDYLASVDEVHAQFRTTMRDFLMNRTFDESAPVLNEDFLLVDPDQLNDVFMAGTDDSDIYAPEADKIIGSILFNVSAKRPIPLFGIPKLEA